MKMYELEVRDSLSLRTSFWVIARDECHAREQQEHLSNLIENIKEIQISVSGSTFVAAGQSEYRGN